MRRSLWLPLLVILVSCGSPGPQGPDLRPAGLPLDVPSEDERIFAEFRDFTVVGYFDPPLLRPGDILVELFAGKHASGRPLRVVRSHVDPVSGVTPREALDFSYAKGQAWGPGGAVTDPERMVMTPDLVASPGGLRDPTNKVVVTRDYYAAVVLGGVTKEFDTLYRGEDGETWQDLKAGIYMLRVAGESHDLAGLSVTRRIEFGLTETMLGRFNPPEHKDRLLAEASFEGLRTYVDFFPGFFSHGDFAYEITGRWMPNNSIEVVNDLPHSLVDGIDTARNDVLLYNISEASATNRIEIGSIATHGLVDSERTTFRYYALGEPWLRFVDRETDRAVTLESGIQALEPFDRLVLTRAEVEFDDWSMGEPGFDVEPGRSLELFADFSRTIRLDNEDRLSVFGVVSPLPTTTTTAGLPVQYELDNRVAEIRSEIRNGATGHLVAPPELRPVGLRRRYDPKRKPNSHAYSVYEFEIEIRPAVEGLPTGSYEVLLECLDTWGEPVAGGRECFEIVVDESR